MERCGRSFGIFRNLHTLGAIKTLKGPHMKHGFSVAIAGLGLLAGGVPLAAHHSTAAVYDISEVVTLKGVVTEVKMTNPHGHISLDVKDAAGNVVNWFVEL